MKHLLARFGDTRTLGGSLAWLFVAAWLFGETGLMCALLVLVALNVRQWFASVRLLRRTEDTATSRIGSAAQGQVELSGEAKPEDGRVLRDPITRDPCVWFRIESYRTRWWLLRRRVKLAESSRAFIVDDGSGRCRVTPADTDFKLSAPLRFGSRFGLHHDLFVIFPGETVQASGHFATSPNPQSGIPTHRLCAAPDGTRCVLSNGSEAQTLDAMRRAARDRAVLALLSCAAVLAWRWFGGA